MPLYSTARDRIAPGSWRTMFWLMTTSVVDGPGRVPASASEGQAAALRGSLRRTAGLHGWPCTDNGGRIRYGAGTRAARIGRMPRVEPWEPSLACQVDCRLEEPCALGAVLRDRGAGVRCDRGRGAEARARTLPAVVRREGVPHALPGDLRSADGQQALLHR